MVCFWRERHSRYWTNSDKCYFANHNIFQLVLRMQKLILLFSLTLMWELANTWFVSIFGISQFIDLCFIQLELLNQRMHIVFNLSFSQCMYETIYVSKEFDSKMFACLSVAALLLLLFLKAWSTWQMFISVSNLFLSRDGLSLVQAMRHFWFTGPFSLSELLVNNLKVNGMSAQVLQLHSTGQC